MPLKLETCSDADMDRAFAVISAAFGREHPYQNTIFPDHDKEPGRKTGAERMLATKKSDPNTTLIKVVDTETDKMVALGKWNVFNGTIPEEVELEGDFWKDQDEKEYAQHLFRGYLAPRRQAIKDSGGKLVCKLIMHRTGPSMTHGGEATLVLTPRYKWTALDLTTVDPDDQRRGAGRMLVKWGTAIADDLGVEVGVSKLQIQANTTWDVSKLTSN